MDGDRRHVSWSRRRVAKAGFVNGQGNRKEVIRMKHRKIEGEEEPIFDLQRLDKHCDILPCLAFVVAAFSQDGLLGYGVLVAVTSLLVTQSYLEW